MASMDWVQRIHQYHRLRQRKPGGETSRAKTFQELALRVTDQSAFNNPAEDLPLFLFSHDWSSTLPSATPMDMPPPIRTPEELSLLTPVAEQNTPTITSAPMTTVLLGGISPHGFRANVPHFTRVSVALSHARVITKV